MISFRIRTHFIFNLTIVSLMLTAAILFFYTAQFKKHALNYLEAYGKSITRNTTFTIADHLITEDYAFLQGYVKEFSALPNINSIEISDAEWTTLAATELDNIGDTMPKILPGKCLNESAVICVRLDNISEQLIITTPITLENIQMGRVRVFLSIKNILSYTREMQIKGAVIGAGFWFFALILGFFASRLVTRPVHDFMKLTENISRGDFKITPPPTNFVQELDKFSKALSIMTQAIDQREKNIRDSEKKYRHLFERSMEGIFVCDKNGSFIDINPAMLAILDYRSREELLSLNLFTEIFSDMSSASSFREKLIQDKFVRGFKLRLNKNNNSPLTISLTCNSVFDGDGNILAFEGVLLDITQQQLDQEKIAQMRNYLNRIIESMPSILIAIDENSNITQWNTAASELTGISSDDALGKKLFDTAPFLKQYKKHFKQIYIDPVPIKLHRKKMSGDDDHIYNLTLFPLITDETSDIVIRLDDITELEMKEKQLRQAQKMESVGTLAGGLAHDFNNVLSGILGNLSIIRYQLNNNDLITEKTLRKYVERMSSAGSRAADLVQQLLALSRKHEADQVPVDLNLSISNVQKISKNTFDRSVEIVTQHADTPAYIMADPTQIEQVILNICINAVHAMTIMRDQQKWGGTLAIRLEKIFADSLFCKTHLEARQGLYWLLSIEDTGIGMDAKTVSAIFDPFFTTKEKDKGTGLGLSMVYNIIKQLDGFISVYSEEKLGSTFNIYLPYLDCETQHYPGTEKTKIYKREGCILVIDDDSIMLDTSRDILQSVGYSVMLAQNGREGVEIYQENQHKINAIVLDMIMPVMSGKETFIEIKKINPDVKILLTSGFKQDSRIQEVINMGTDGFLHKPYTIEQLAEALDKIIQN